MNDARKDFRKRNLSKWEETIKAMFPYGAPNYCEWTTIDSIIEILNAIGSNNQLAHMFYPSGGGLDLEGAKTSVEKNCIEIFADGSATILKPQKLCFHFFGNIHYEWAYLRLETYSLEPSGVYDDYDDDFFNEYQYEELTEVSPGEYADRSVWDKGYYGYDENGEKRLPKEARVVARSFSGSFVFFAKGSTYNGDSSTYDARHNKMNDQQFKQHIEKAIASLTKI